MLRQRHPTEDEAAAERDPTVADDRPVVDEARDDEYETRDDPPPVGTDPMWASPQGDVSPSAVPLAAAPVSTGWQFTWGQVLIVIAGLASLVFGVGAVILGGLAGSVTAPVVRVFTFNHTPLLGLMEVGAGAVLVVSGLVRGGRWVAGPVGVAAIVGGALVIAKLEWVQTELAAEQRFGWVAIAVGTTAYLGAMVPAKRRPSRRVDDRW